MLTRALKSASRKEVTKLGPAGSRSVLQKQQVKTSDRLSKMLQEYSRHLPEVINATTAIDASPYALAT